MKRLTKRQQVSLAEEINPEAAKQFFSRCTSLYRNAAIVGTYHCASASGKTVYHCGLVIRESSLNGSPAQELWFPFDRSNSELEPAIINTTEPREWVKLFSPPIEVGSKVR